MKAYLLLGLLLIFSLQSCDKNDDDTSPPAIATLSPANEAVNIAASSNLVITFNEPVKAGSGNITIHQGTASQVIDVSNTTLVAVDGNTVTIDPPADFPAGAAVHITMPRGVFTDIAGNAFAGITNATAWNFSVAAPAVEPPPAFLLTGWISMDPTGFAATTYDFNQQQAAGLRTVEIRPWQRIGTLGWQSNQIYSALFTATTKKINFSSAIGYKDEWDILSVDDTSMTVKMGNGQTVTLYNCKRQGWPSVIHMSTKSCR